MKKEQKTYVFGVMRNMPQAISANEKKPQLYHIEMEDDIEETLQDCEDAEEPTAKTECAEISVQAMDGITSF